MNKQLFLKELGYLLQDISDEDREDALGYYEGYFVDAGEINEAKVLTELQSPKRVAALIKAGLNETFEETIEYSESSMGDSRFNKQREVFIPNDQPLKENQNKQKWENQNLYNKINLNQKNKVATLLILLFIGVPFLLLGLPILGTGILLFFTLILLIFSIGIVVGSLGFVAASFSIMILLKSIWEINRYPSASLVGIGVSLLLSASAIGLFMSLKWPFMLLPELMKAITNLVRNVIDKVGSKR